MVVSNDTLLNILLPKNNQVLKDVLKEADSKFLESNKSLNLADVLKNLTDDVKLQTKSNETITNILKESSVFKELGSFTKNLQTLIDSIPKNSQLSELKTTLSSFLTNIKDLDENNLKQLIQKSGIFLESKLEKLSLTQNSSTLNETLTQLKDIFKNENTQEAKTLLSQIDRLISKSDKNPLTEQNIGTNLKSVINTLKNIETNQIASKLDSVTPLLNKLENLNISLNLNEAKTTLTQNSSTLNDVKTTLVQNSSTLNETLTQLKDIFKNENTNEAKSLLSQIDRLISKNDKGLLNEQNIGTNLKGLIDSLKNVQTNQTASKIENFTPLLNKLENLNISLNLNEAKVLEDFSKNDIKATLIQIQDETANKSIYQDINKNVDKLLTQIDYYQLLSLTSSSNYLYLPFVWDMLDEGSLSIKKTDEERYFCEIHLSLKELGEIDLLLGLYEEKNLDISIFSDKESTKKLVQENLTDLKIGLRKVGITAQNIQIFDIKQDEEKEEQTAYSTILQDFDDIGFGIDIKV